MLTVHVLRRWLLFEVTGVNVSLKYTYLTHLNYKSHDCVEYMKKSSEDRRCPPAVQGPFWFNCYSPYKGKPSYAVYRIIQI